jgi:hypothetical protein
LHEKARRLFAVEGEEREDPAIVYLVDLNPAKGREQAGPRFVIIVSPCQFYRPPRVCPTAQAGNFACDRDTRKKTCTSTQCLTWDIAKRSQQLPRRNWQLIR